MSAVPTVGPRALTVDAKPMPRQRSGIGLFAKIVAVGFWATLVTLVVSAAVAPGFMVLALLPLLGLPYLLFCFIALTSDRNVE
jgi:hypothetical protein